MNDKEIDGNSMTKSFLVFWLIMFLVINLLSLIPGYNQIRLYSGNYAYSDNEYHAIDAGVFFSLILRLIIYVFPLFQWTRTDYREDRYRGLKIAWWSSFLLVLITLMLGYTSNGFFIIYYLPWLNIISIVYTISISIITLFWILKWKGI